ncbi:MAG: class I SAM-dependent methyltransferase [Planctomycetota bacterium]
MSSASNFRATKLKLGTVQQTLLTPLYARAREINHASPIIVDRKAAEIIETLEHDFDAIARFNDTLTGCAIRASILDGWMKSFLQEHPESTVTLIGEGLDTTFDRNDNGKATWFEMDLPDVISLRRNVFEPHLRRHLLPANLMEDGWLDQISQAGSKSQLFQFAGVTMYLKPDVVRNLFTRIADRFPGAVILFDTTSELGVKNSHRWECTVRTTGANYYFGIDNPRDIANWHPSLEVTNVESMMNYRRDRWSWKVRLATFWWRRLRYSYLINRAVVRAS